MTTDRWPGTYNGFSGTGAPLHDTGLRIERPEPRRFEPHEYELPSRPRRRVSRGMLLGGLGAAVGLGLVFGLLAKPDLGEEARTREPMQPVTPATAPTAASVPIEVAPASTPSAPPPAGKLEVLPPELARAVQPRSPTVVPTRPEPVETRTARVRDAAPVPTREAAPAPPREAAPPPPRVAAVTPPPAARPSFNCRYAGTRAERMICADPVLAQLDRRLDRAFDRAVSSGIPYRELRAEQDDWLAIREDAARRSPAAVESIYRQRIAELNDLAG